MSRKIFASVLLLLLTASVAVASSEPPLEPGVSNQIQAVTRSFIEAQMLDGVYLYYDAPTDEMMRLEFKMLHPLVSSEGEFYVARADFFDEQGRPVNMRFLVVMRDDRPFTLQAVAQGSGVGLAAPCADAS